MGQDMHLGGKTIGGQTTQDADVSYVNLSGHRFLWRSPQLWIGCGTKRV